MTKVLLAEAVATASGLTKAQAEKGIDATFEVIKTFLAAGGKVPIQKFGTFKTSYRAARKGRNPQTGEAIEIAPKTVVRFVPAPGLKELFNS